MKKEIRCHDCGVKEGEIHEYGCDMEKCPFCGRQLISCDCCYEQLGFKMDDSKKYCGLPKDIYENGLTGKLSERWFQILTNKGRIPFILYPIVCVRCGVLWPELFMVPNKEWEKYVQPDMQDKVLCKNCYTEIKGLIDQYRK